MDMRGVENRQWGRKYPPGVETRPGAEFSTPSNVSIYSFKLFDSALR